MNVARGRKPKAAPVAAPPTIVRPVLKVPGQVIQPKQIIRCEQCGSERVRWTAGHRERGVAYFECQRCTNGEGEPYTFKLPFAGA